MVKHPGQDWEEDGGDATKEFAEQGIPKSITAKENLVLVFLVFLS